ncbi:MAG: hypothetical protein D6761_04160, partial [Candidatus Dadabacteria bacterium]
MPRQRRTFVPNGYYHVIQRGVNRRKIFVDQADRRFFLTRLAQLPERYGIRIHAWCLMDNHVHLVLQNTTIPLAGGLCSLFGAYARRFNRRYGRTGHLFQGRHHAILVKSDEQLFELVRYVHLNPVRAGLVANASEWPWSSDRAYRNGGAHVPSWLTTGVILNWLSSKPSIARRHYAQFLDQSSAWTPNELDPDPFVVNAAADVVDADHQQGRWLERQRERWLGGFSLEQAERAICRQLAIDVETLSRPRRLGEATTARGVLGWLARQGAPWRICDLAARYGRSESAISWAATRVEAELREDGKLR